MDLLVEGGRVWLDPRDSAFNTDPYEYYRALRGQQLTCFYWENAHAYTFMGIDDIEAMLRDSRLGRQISHIRSDFLDAQSQDHLAPFYRCADRQILRLEPPDHTRLRAIVSRSFQAARSSNLSRWLSDVCDELIDGFVDQAETDLIGDYAARIPMRTLVHLHGIPPDMDTQIVAWSNDIAGMYELAHSAGQAQRAVQSTMAFTDWMRDFVRFRRQYPSNDIVSHLLEAETQPQSISEDEIVASAILLLTAGYETTRHVIGNSLNTLLRHRVYWESICEDVGESGVTGRIVEELIRYDPPLHYITRWVLVDKLELGGFNLRFGDRVAMLIGAANRDPKRFVRPDHFDIARQLETGNHISFGGGIHYCVGAQLARLEMRIAIERLATRAPRIGLAYIHAQRDVSFGFHGLQRLKVSLSA